MPLMHHEKSSNLLRTATLCVFAVVVCAVYFLPLWLGLPLPTGAFYQRMWLVSWI